MMEASCIERSLLGPGPLPPQALFLVALELCLPNQMFICAVIIKNAGEVSVLLSVYEGIGAFWR